MESIAVDAISRIERRMINREGCEPDEDAVRYVIARKEFAQLAHDEGEVPGAQVAVEQIQELAQKHDLDAESLAMLITWDEEMLTQNFLNALERNPIGSPRYKRCEILAQSRLGWKRLSQQRRSKVWDAYQHFVSVSDDICKLRYDQTLPSAEAVLERVHNVAAQFEVDSWFLADYVQRYQLSDWDLLRDRKAYLYHGLRAHFQNLENDG